MDSAAPVTPLLEFDGSLPAFIKPAARIPTVDVPPACVVTFFGDAVQRLRADGRAQLLTDNAWEDGPHPLLELEQEGPRVAGLHSGVGAPLAGALLEEVIAMGAAVARFRGVALGQVLHGGDDLLERFSDDLEPEPGATGTV